MFDKPRMPDLKHFLQYHLNNFSFTSNHSIKLRSFVLELENVSKNICFSESKEIIFNFVSMLNASIRFIKDLNIVKTFFVALNFCTSDFNFELNILMSNL